MAGGNDRARIVVLPTASFYADDPAEADYFLADWRELGAVSVQLLHTRDRQLANDRDFVKPLQEATAVWMSGGDQNRLISTYRGTLVEKELHNLLQRGGVIGGTSAGAAAMSDLMIQGGDRDAKTGPGFGFLINVVVDQHFVARNRVERLRGVLAKNKAHAGLGIDEGTAVIIRGQSLTIQGNSTVTVIWPQSSNHAGQEQTLSAGKVLDLATLCATEDRKPAMLKSPSIASKSFYTEPLDDPAATYLTTDAFEVHADGMGDDAPAIQAAIDKVAENRIGGVLFIPPGTYRLGSTVYVWPGVRLIGYGEHRPVFKLAENTPGFQEGQGKYLLYFSGGRNREGVPRDGSPGTFYSAASNIDLEIEAGNPAAIGIRFHVAQHCYLSHMDFRLGSARAGLEDIGNEVEDLHFHGGQFGVITARSAPGWPILMIDCSFENQSVAAISCDEAGLAIVRPYFKNLPTAVSIVPDKPDELWLSDGRFENITGPALVISNEHNARTQVNLQNMTCENVPTLASFRTSGKNIVGPSSKYVVEQFSHGLHIGEMGAVRRIKTTLVAKQVDVLPEVVASDIPDLPPRETWVNVHDLGVVGDGESDDTAALQAAIAKHRTLYFPTGWYNVSETLTLRSESVLIGLHPLAAVINLPDNSPAFQGAGEPQAVIEAPPGGTNIVTGMGVYTGESNPRAVGVKWMAGTNSMLNDVRLHGGHGTRTPCAAENLYGRNNNNRELWNSQNTSLWVTNDGGGTFKDIWTANPYAKSGMLITDTSTSGRLYAMSAEHHVDNEVVIRNAANWKFYALQFEEEREESPRALPLQIENSKNLLFANTFFYRVVSCFQPYPHAVNVAGSSDIRFRNVHCYSNSKVSFDSTVFDATSKTDVRDSEFAVLDMPGASPRENLQAGRSANAKVELIADGFLNIAGAAVDPNGVVYFADSRNQRIYRWLEKESRAELVRVIPERPVQLAFDQAGNLLVVAYEGNGSVFALAPNFDESQIVKLEPLPAEPRPGLVPVLPLNLWKTQVEFIRDATLEKPFQYVSPDGTTFIPASEDFATGAERWGSKLSNELRAFSLAPAIKGRPFYVSNEAELQTWSFEVGPAGTLANPKLFAQEGGEGLAVDAQGNVYLAAGQVRVFNPSGELIDTIDVPQRPTSLAFGGEDRKTLYITARSSLYRLRTQSRGSE